MKKEKKYCVYKHTNQINGKVYIGITCQRPERRWGHDGSRYKQSIYFYAAITKYGWDNFDHEIQVEGLTQEEAEAMEIKLISDYHSDDPQYGYNLTAGGRTHIPNEATRTKLSERWKGEANPMYGKHLSDETKRKISEALTGGKMPPEQGQKISQKMKELWASGRFDGAHCGKPPKRVRCIELDQTFDSIADAVRYMGKPVKNKYNLSICLHNPNRTYCGYHWEEI